ncbi:MAG TPA: hypothetical protein VFX49_16910, partial [Chloroflexota bacterium]|nr:hypothetical protein [Chloroflexota bacterium]
DEYAAELVSGETSGRYPPLDAARWLDDLAASAERHLDAARAQIGDRDGPEFRRWAADIAIQAALGRFFARKLSAGVAYALYQQTGDQATLHESIAEYRAARDAFAVAARHGAVYQDDVTFGSEPHQRGHWRDRLTAMDEDIARLDATLKAPETRVSDGVTRARPTPALAPIPGTREVQLGHTPPEAFRPGAPLTVELDAPHVAAPRVAAVELRYRHANQAETYRGIEMEPAAPNSSTTTRFSAVIPPDYTDSPYPLVYAFRVRFDDGCAAPYPGLDPSLANQPYYLIRPTG